MKINFTEEDSFLMAMVQGPIWQDGCEHDKGTYVVSFTVHSRLNKIDQYDLYIFENNGRQEVCIRYGAECQQYISPGSLGEFLSRSCNHEPYQTAVRILLHYGNVSWSLKEKNLTADKTTVN